MMPGTATLLEDVYVFASLPQDAKLGEVPLAMVLEEEGTLAVVKRREAFTTKLHFKFSCRIIRLNSFPVESANLLMSKLASEIRRLNVSANFITTPSSILICVPEDLTDSVLHSISSLFKPTQLHV